MTPQKSSAAVQQHDDARCQIASGKDDFDTFIVPHLTQQINPREARKRLIFGIFRGTGIALLIIGGWFAAGILCAALDVWGVLLVILAVWALICGLDAAERRCNK